MHKCAENLRFLLEELVCLRPLTCAIYAPGIRKLELEKFVVCKGQRKRQKTDLAAWFYGCFFSVALQKANWGA